MQRILGHNFSSDLSGTTFTHPNSSNTSTATATTVADRKPVPMHEGATCCPSTGMVEFLREYLPDEFMLTSKGTSVVRGYWHIRPARLLVAEAERGQARKYQEAIRLTWPAQSLWEDNYMVFPAPFDSCHQCMEVPIPGLTYLAEIGWLSEDGYFIPILRSNWSDCSKNYDRPFPKD